MRLRLDSVWAHLWGTLALVIAPAALLIVLLAYSLFGAAQETLLSTQSSAVALRTTALRAWLDSAGRSLANEAFAARYVSATHCAGLADAFLKRNAGFASVRFFDESSTACAAGDAIGADGTPGLPDAPGKDVYRLDVKGSQLWITVAHESETGAKRLLSVLVVDQKLLRERLLAASAHGETHVAIVTAKGDLVAADPRSGDSKWFPAAFAFDPAAPTWRALDRAGEDAAYGIGPIEGSTLSVLMRFDDSRRTAAQQRLALLCAALLGALGALGYVYAATIRRDIVMWIEGIDVAARARTLDFESMAKAPLGPRMPRELRSVAESFNAMADHVADHQTALRASLAENRELMLEMHHRIKNSLQVIQSYLALIRRSSPRAEALLLARIEARVGVLAVAYRLALTPKGMRPIAIKPFVEEICASAIGGLRRPRQRAAYSVSWDGELPVDRAIPLGLGLVEALIAAFSATDAGYVGVRFAPDEDGAVDLRVESDTEPSETGLPERVMRGLANQLGATERPKGLGDILAWRFHP